MKPRAFWLTCLGYSNARMLSSRRTWKRRHPIGYIRTSTYCTDRADPRRRLAWYRYIIKCLLNFWLYCLTSLFPKIWHWRDSNPCAFFVKDIFLNGKSVVIGHRSQARYPLRHGGGGNWQQWKSWWYVYVHVELGRYRAVRSRRIYSCRPSYNSERYMRRRLLYRWILLYRVTKRRIKKK